jgi:hypothetical protein
MVGRVPRTWRAKLEDLMTSMEETRESIMSDSRGELSMEIAFALPLITIVVLLQRLIRIECEMEASISIGALSPS